MMKFAGMFALAVATVLAYTPVASAAAIVAKGKGDNGNGTQFTAKGKYITSSSGIKNVFRIKKGTPRTDYVFCLSSDGCTFTATLTPGVGGRAKLKYDEKKGTLPSAFPEISPGDTLIVNGQDIGTYLDE